jgi:hypothetical protein
MLHTGDRSQGFGDEIMASSPILIGNEADATGISFVHQPGLPSVAYSILFPTLPLTLIHACITPAK